MGLRSLLALLALTTPLLATGAAAQAAAEQSHTLTAGPLRTALVDPTAFGGKHSRLAFRRTRGAGATYVRLVLAWRSVAPERVYGDRTDPENPGYSWSAFDAQVRNAREYGLTPIVCLTAAPAWAFDRRAGGLRTTWPKLDELTKFAEAAAWRYSGYYGLPAVRVWQAWNEPNARSNLRPQFRGERAVSPARYLRMVNAIARGVRVPDSQNRVVAGGLSPFGHNSREIQVVAPLRFMRAFLCVSPREDEQCDASVAFDVWAHHPYTTGGPTRSARKRDDVSIGDLPRMRAVLEAAMAAGRVVSRRDVQFWVTEFSWDTNPYDPSGIPSDLHARWVAEALYRMWKARVSLVTWFLVRDTPLLRTPYQSGLWYEGGGSVARDRPKLSLRAFRFPFVALPVKRAVLVWGRLPHGSRGEVVVQRRVRRVWKPVLTVQADRYGIFRTRLKGKLAGPFRAFWTERPEASVPFTLRPVADRDVTPFGCGGGVRCIGGPRPSPPS